MAHVRYLKYDGTLHWHFTMRRLGVDDHGVWLGAPRGTPVRRNDEPPITSGAFALLIPRHDWWTAVWNEPAPRSPFHYEVYADICTPARWEPRRVSMVDLDLDVARTPTGETRILDKDEFAEHRIAYGYPGDVVTAAQRAAATLFEMVATRREPFGDLGVSYLERAVTLPARARRR
jgi:protein associated with RNAse G/E